MNLCMAAAVRKLQVTSVRKRLLPLLPPLSCCMLVVRAAVARPPCCMRLAALHVLPRFCLLVVPHAHCFAGWSSTTVVTVLRVEAVFLLVSALSSEALFLPGVGPFPVLLSSRAACNGGPEVYL